MKVEHLTPQVEEGKRVKTSYLEELKNEFKKISWTTKEELIFSAKAVVGTTFFFGVGIYLVDLFIKGVLNSFSVVFHLIFG